MRRSRWAGLIVVIICASAGLIATGANAAQQRAATANPVPYTSESIARGKTYFLQNCQSCHDEDGRARSAAVAIAADLTDPDRWKFGTGDAELFKTIKNGAADAMPPFATDLKDEQIWDVVNFIRSIGPESKRPS
jgi:mono/diheme cytochrome c family protein